MTTDVTLEVWGAAHLRWQIEQLSQNLGRAGGRTERGHWSTTKSTGDGHIDGVTCT